MASDIAGSSNGRTIAFGAIYHGSNPCPAARHKYPPREGYFVPNLDNVDKELNERLAN